MNIFLEDSSSVAQSDYESVQQIMDECRSLSCSDDETNNNGKSRNKTVQKTPAQLEWEREAAIRGAERALLTQVVSIKRFFNNYLKVKYKSNL